MKSLSRRSGPIRRPRTFCVGGGPDGIRSRQAARSWRFEMRPKNKAVSLRWPETLLDAGARRMPSARAFPTSGSSVWRSRARCAKWPASEPDDRGALFALGRHGSHAHPDAERGVPRGGAEGPGEAAAYVSANPPRPAIARRQTGVLPDALSRGEGIARRRTGVLPNALWVRGCAETSGEAGAAPRPALRATFSRRGRRRRAGSAPAG